MGIVKLKVPEANPADFMQNIDSAMRQSYLEFTMPPAKPLDIEGTEKHCILDLDNVRTNCQ